jgi:ribonuclease P protein component
VEPRSYRFPRSRRLKRQRLIRPLFERGRSDVESVRVGPVVVRYGWTNQAEVGVDSPFQVGFAVGRGIGSKPRRNRLRRVMREVVRLHQHDLLDALAGRPEVLTLMVLYRGRPDAADAAVRRALPEALARVSAALRSPSGGHHDPAAGE